MKEQIFEILQKIPYTLVTAAIVGWFAWEYYDFQSSVDSPLARKKQELVAAKQTQAVTQKRVKEAEQFFRTLETKKSELRSLMRKLTEMKASLNESIDKVQVQATINKETNNAGLRFLNIAPGGERERALYAEQVFKLNVRGVFGQLVFFLKRLSELETILRVDSFSLRPLRTSESGDKFAILEMSLDVRAFRYIRSEADKITEAEEKGQGKGGKNSSNAAKGSSG